MVDASDVVLTLLTGLRPEFTALTLTALRGAYPGVLETSTVLVHHNTGDSATAASLAHHADLLDEVETFDDLWSINDATFRLAQRVTETGKRYWLYLQDDFRARLGAGPWLDDARGALEAGASQVRLRLSREKVLPHNSVTGEKVRWHPVGPHVYSHEAHFTRQPSLIMADDALVAYPAESEADSQALRHAADLGPIVQLRPGCLSTSDTGRPSTR